MMMKVLPIKSALCCKLAVRAKDVKTRNGRIFLKRKRRDDRLLGGFFMYHFHSRPLGKEQYYSKIRSKVQFSEFAQTDQSQGRGTYLHNTVIALLVASSTCFPIL